MTKNKKIKTRILNHILVVCLISLAMMSCQSHEQKADDAFTKVKEGKILNADSELALTEPKTIEVIKTIEMLDDWSKFKFETEKRIAINEKKIREIKGTPKADAKLFKKVTTSEQENTDLRRQINEYEEALNINLKEFKIKINQDLNSINSDLNDLTAGTKK